jgi:hypothetical protein
MYLYIITGYHWKTNQWYRFAVSAANAETAIQEVKDWNLSQVNASYICATADDVFKEI